MRKKTKQRSQSEKTHGWPTPDPSLHKDSLSRLELAGEFAALSKKSGYNAPPLSPEEIQAEIDAYRREKAR